MPMKNLLKIVTECVDKFSEQENIARLAAIIGGEAVILHGIPRTTLDVDIRNLFLVMDDSEKKKTFELARSMSLDKNLSKILNEGRRRRKTMHNISLTTLKNNQDT